MFAKSNRRFLELRIKSPQGSILPTLPYWQTNQQRSVFISFPLQIMPPTDMIPEVIRSIIIYMNITNAAILYDDSFVMDHKYKALLQNIPTRHVITSIGNDKDRGEQIEKLRNLDINNFFILGSFPSIRKVLGKINDLSYTI